MGGTPRKTSSEKARAPAHSGGNVSGDRSTLVHANCGILNCAPSRMEGLWHCWKRGEIFRLHVCSGVFFLLRSECSNRHGHLWNLSRC